MMVKKGERVNAKPDMVGEKGEKSKIKAHKKYKKKENQ